MLVQETERRLTTCFRLLQPHIVSRPAERDTFTRLNSSMIMRIGFKVFSPVINSVGTFNRLTTSRSTIGNESCDVVSAFHS